MLELAVQVAALGVFLWSVTQQLPKARREEDAFGIACTVVTALLALALFLFVGIRAR